MSIWDDPELRAGGDFVKFENPGDSVSGVINAVRAHRFEDGKAAPQILLTTDDGEEKTITAGQVRLKIALAEQRPEAGDHLTITLTNVEKRTGGKTLKHFDIKVGRGGAAPVAAPAVPVPAPAPAPAPVIPAAPPAAPVAAPAPVMAGAPAGVTAETLAALAALTPEQRAALGLA